MKIRLTIEINAPDDLQDWSDGELAQYLHDQYVHYVPMQHLIEALHWCAEAKVGTPEEKPLDKRIYEDHKAAGQWTKATWWKFERLGEVVPD
jgi:hypothetical protein